MKSIELTIVIVNWNTKELLRNCLISIYDSPVDIGIEIIVVDNCSNDGSPDMVEAQFPKIILIRNSENRGFAAANNQAFKIANGQHILLLNSDTIVHGRVLENSVRFLETHSKVGAMGCRVLNTDGTVQLTCSEYPSLTNQLIMASGLWKLSTPKWFGKYLMTDWKRDSERNVEVISGCYLLIRKKILTEVGMLDENFFFFGEETDWCLRIRGAGWRLMFAPVGEITHYGGASVKKLSHKRDIMLTGAKIKLHRKHGGLVPAAICWLIAAGFNGSRAVFWTIRSAVDQSDLAKTRSIHFRRVVLGLGQIWKEKA